WESDPAGVLRTARGHVSRRAARPPRGAGSGDPAGSPGARAAFLAGQFSTSMAARGVGGRAVKVPMMIRYRTWTALVAAALVTAGTNGAWGQEAPGAVSVLLADASVKAAMDAAHATEAQTIDQQVRFCEVPAPPFKESSRAQLLEATFQELGLQHVRIDRAG